MANPLVLKVVVDDKGNPVLQDMNLNITKMNKNTKGLGRTLTHVFGSAVMIQGLAKFRQSVAFAGNEVLNFNKIMKQTEGITNTTGKPLDMLKQKVIDVSNATEHTSTNLATAILNISKMGFTLEESLAVVPHLADLATSSTSDLEEVTQIAVQTMKSFQMEATDMEHIVNVIQGTVSSTAIGFLDFAESMKFVAPIAKTMNISLEQTAAMIGVLGDIGIKGSLGGTTLKNMFLNIMQPSDKVRKIIEGLNEEGLTFNKILKAMDESGVGVKDFLETFNKRAVAGSLALSQLTEKTEALEEILVKDGIQAAKVAEIIRQAWIPQMENLRNTFVNTFVVMGEILDQSDIGLGIHGITEEFIKLQEWIKENPEALINFVKEATSIIKVLGIAVAKTFTFIVKNLSAINKLVKIFIGYKLRGIILANATALIKFTANLKLAKLASMSLTSVIPVFGQVAMAVWAISEAFDWMAKNAIKARKAAIQASFGTQEGEILKQIDAVWALKKALSGVDEEFKNVSQTISTQSKGSGMMGMGAIKIDKAERVQQVIKSIAKEFGMTEEAIKLFSQNSTAHLDSLYKKLKDARGKADLLDKINDKIKFTKPELKDKPGGAKGKKEWWEEQYEHLLASAKLAEDIAKSLKLGIPTDTVMSAYRGQLEGAGVNLKDISSTGTPLSTGTTAGGESGDFFGVGRIAAPSIGIGNIEQVNKDILAAKISSLIQIENAQKDHNNKMFKLGKDLQNNLNSLYDEQAIDYIKSEQVKFDEARRLEEELKDYRFDQFMQYAEAAQMQVDIIQMIQDAGFEKSKARMEKELQLFEDKAKRELSVVGNNAFKKAIVEKKIQKDRQKLMAEQERLEKEQLNKRRVWSMIEVAINTAVGVSAALRGSPPASYVMAALTSALGLAQIALIASQDSYRGGGFTGYGFDNETAGTVHKNEYVVDANKTRLLGGPEGVEEMIDNRINDSFSNRGPQVAVFVENVIGEEDWVDDMAVKINRSIQRQLP